jgi:hypothetical protein
MYAETEDVIRALAENAESVCRAYLPAGRREGSYWIVGVSGGAKVGHGSGGMSPLRAA